jgi:hypothetical protein
MEILIQIRIGIRSTTLLHSAATNACVFANTDVSIALVPLFYKNSNRMRLRAGQLIVFL